ncbi:MAG: hypothetical protein WAX11_08405, partial [Gemmiger qucibialis]
FAVSATGGAHLCSIQYYLRFWLGICRTSLAVSALRIMRYCPKAIESNALEQSLGPQAPCPAKNPITTNRTRPRNGQDRPLQNKL